MDNNFRTTTTTTTTIINLTNLDYTNNNGIINNFLIQILFYILYSVIFLLGLFGNIIVCYIVYSNKAMQTVTNLFITNLALSDILLCILCVPFTPLYTFLGKWIFGNITCHLVGYAQATSVYISTLTLTAIAIDRYFVILYPLKRRMKLIRSLLILLAIWTFSMFITLPYGICMQVKNYSGRVVCEENWPYDNFELAFGIFTFIMQFILPFCVMGFCYLKISERLNERAKYKPGKKTLRKEMIEQGKKRRTNRMLISMVTIFGICWFPLNLTNVINDIYNFNNNSYFHLAFFLSHCLAMSSTCYNPFLYAWLNDNFRKEFKLILPCLSNDRTLTTITNINTTTTTSRYTCNTNGNEGTNDTFLNTTVLISRNNNKLLEPREPLVQPTF